ncbi:oligopeptide transporter-like protein [Ascodesmis nigricans]|uniref:Oligopeptide transporter-like protein n=1 Tax=Ascodesmis nigricans TaxID=341454 RepID=A0A4S2MYI0_9PEZI|nr:oligopeptide transporter-like protein [Ascodesmis nigricans]
MSTSSPRASTESSVASNHRPHTTTGNDGEDSQFTLRGIAAGLLIGTIVAFSNTYFGLQTGWVSMMSMPASLIGYAIFKSLHNQLRLPFTPVENVLVQTVAVAVGSMPLSAGFVGVIPALERLLKPSEGGPLSLSTSQLIIWGIGVSFFGVLFAVPLRKQVILREKLKFPSGTATALMISVLHGTKSDVQKTDSTSQSVDEDERSEPLIATSSDDASWKRNTKLLFYSFAVSGVYTLCTYFFPIIRNIPFLGAKAGSVWLWTFNPSPAYVGQGIIMGPETTGHMLLGAILGWAILSPLAKNKGWAPGPVSDYQKGSRGWLIWVSLAIMLADSLISLGWVAFSYVVRFSRRKSPRRSSYESIPQEEASTSESSEVDPVALRRARRSARLKVLEAHDEEEDNVAPNHLVPMKMAALGLVASSVLCVVSTKLVFHQVPIYAMCAALPLAFILSLVGVRALGQTDLNPVSGISKLTQLVFALIVPASNPAAVLINLIAGAVSEAGAQQAGDIMQDLKTGHLLRASPRAQFYGQLIGSVFGAIISAVIYRLYSAVYEIPGLLFQVPTAFVWIDCSRLVYGQGLPEGARDFAWSFGLLFAVTTMYKAWSSKAMPWIPGGVAVAVGMYNVPSFTLARAVGGAVQWFWSRKFGNQAATPLIVAASGLILGEGIVSLVNLLMANFGVPHL